MGQASIDAVLAGTKGFAVALLAPLTARIGTRPRVAADPTQILGSCSGPSALAVIEFTGEGSLPTIQALLRDGGGLRIVAGVPTAHAAAEGTLLAMGVEVGRWDGKVDGVVGAVERAVAAMARTTPAGPAAARPPGPVPPRAAAPAAAPQAAARPVNPAGPRAPGPQAGAAPRPAPLPTATPAAPRPAAAPQSATSAAAPAAAAAQPPPPARSTAAKPAPPARAAAPSSKPAAAAPAPRPAAPPAAKPAASPPPPSPAAKSAAAPVAATKPALAEAPLPAARLAPSAAPLPAPKPPAALADPPPPTLERPPASGPAAPAASRPAAPAEASPAAPSPARPPARFFDDLESEDVSIDDEPAPSGAGIDLHAPGVYAPPPAPPRIACLATTCSDEQAEEAMRAAQGGGAEGTPLGALAAKVLEAASDLERSVLAGDPQPVEAGPVLKATVMRLRVAEALATTPAPGSPVDAGALGVVLGEIDALLAEVAPLLLRAPVELAPQLEEIRNSLVRDAIDFSDATSRVQTPAPAPAAAPLALGNARARGARILSIEKEGAHVPLPGRGKRIAMVVLLGLAVLAAGAYHLSGLFRRPAAPPPGFVGVPPGAVGLESGKVRVLSAPAGGKLDPAAIEQFKVAEEAKGNSVVEAVPGVWVSQPRPPGAGAKP